MKKEEVKDLIREYMTLRKRIENLQDELRELEDRYEETGDLLWGYRSKTFIQSVIQCLVDMEECNRDDQYDDLFASLTNIVENFQEFDADRRNYTPNDLLHLYDEEVEK
jgi:predicted  nucleic acid-binding Zn-ribbon protein